MNKEILKNILILDSIYKVIPWTDRVIIHLLFQDKVTKVSPLIEDLYEWMIVWGWLPPELVYGQDRLLYVKLSNGERILALEYRKLVKPKDLP